MSMSIRDICPIHGTPMWHWPAGGDDAYACQHPECDVTKPVTAVEFGARAAQQSMDALRYAMLHTGPTVLAASALRIRVTSIS